jgi:hypothetical protein
LAASKWAGVGVRRSYAGHRAPTFAKRNFLHGVDEWEAAVIAGGDLLGARFLDAHTASGSF